MLIPNNTRILFSVFRHTDNYFLLRITLKVASSLDVKNVSCYSIHMAQETNNETETYLFTAQEIQESAYSIRRTWGHFTVSLAADTAYDLDPFVPVENTDSDEEKDIRGSIGFLLLAPDEFVFKKRQTTVPHSYVNANGVNMIPAITTDGSLQIIAGCTKSREELMEEVIEQNTGKQFIRRSVERGRVLASPSWARDYAYDKTGQDIAHGLSDIARPLLIQKIPQLETNRLRRTVGLLSGKLIDKAVLISEEIHEAYCRNAKPATSLRISA